jgi:hypothetical protein
MLIDVPAGRVAALNEVAAIQPDIAAIPTMSFECFIKE